MKSRMLPLVEKTGAWIERRVLPIGWFGLLTGMFWLPDRPDYHRLFYVLLAAPTLLALICRPPHLLVQLKNPLTQAFLMFAGYMLLSLLWSDAHDSLGGLAKRPFYILTLFLACGLMAQQSLGLLMTPVRAAAWVCNVAALASLVWYIISQHGLIMEQGVLVRFTGYGSLYNPLLSAHVYGFFAAWWIARWFQQERWLSPSILLSLGLLGVLLVATGSRTPLIALGVTVLWQTALTTDRRKWGVLLCCCGAALLLTALYPEALTQRGLSYRPEIWSQALQQIGEKPWFGHGMGHEVIIKIAAVEEAFADPHNIQLAVLLSGGIVGWLLWISMYLIALGYCLRHRHDAAVCTVSALLVFGLAAGMAEGGAYLSRPKEHWFLTWIALAMLAGVWAARRRALSARTAGAGPPAVS